jgi:hypothetical protein
MGRISRLNWTVSAALAKGRKAPPAKIKGEKAKRWRSGTNFMGGNDSGIASTREIAKDRYAGTSFRISPRGQRQIIAYEWLMDAQGGVPLGAAQGRQPSQYPKSESGKGPA